MSTPKTRAEDADQSDFERRYKNPAAVALGSIKSARKAASSASNGRKGGRPRHFPYAVLDANQPSDLRISPESCHLTREAAIEAARKLNARNPNNHYLAVQWAGSVNAREFWPCCLEA